MRARFLSGGLPQRFKVGTLDLEELVPATSPLKSLHEGTGPMDFSLFQAFSLSGRSA